jgi:hypothetical protein
MGGEPGSDATEESHEVGANNQRHTIARIEGLELLLVTDLESEAFRLSERSDDLAVDVTIQ